jgi:hypothetical protein
MRYGEKTVALVKEILENLPECCVCLDCVSWRYEPEWTFEVVEWIDDDTSKTHTLTLAKALRAFHRTVKYLVEKCGHKREHLMDAGYWDAGTTDDLVQMAVLGGVVYG